MSPANINEASRLMTGFANASGLTGDAEPRRYLWTDAHAVCNFLTLADATGDSSFEQLAAALVDQVHDVLGRHRADDERRGWISGMSEAEGRLHPTIGGLRIGKPLPERSAGELPDARAEWDQDGQYYHYLTKWMHALLQLARASGAARYLDWARELAVTAHARFRAPSGPPRLYWKMSIDLSYPLVPSSGLHDPLDGLVTALTLRAATPDQQAPELEPAIAELTELCWGLRWETDDPLGIGGVLFDAARLAQIAHSVEPTFADTLLVRLLDAADIGLDAFLRSGTLEASSTQRLAFRELGLGIGLQAMTLMRALDLSSDCRARLSRLQPRAASSAAIVGFWSDPARQRSSGWADHQDINDVMLATCLAPARFVELRDRH